MKQTTIIGIILVLALMLAVTGCGDKDEPESKPAETAEPVLAEGVDAPQEETPEEEIADVPEDAPAPEEDVPEEDVPEEDVPEEDVPEEDVPEESVPEDEPEEPADEAELTGIEEIGQESEEEDVTAATYKIISLKDLKAYPEEIHTPVGSTVEWRNVNDNLQHIIGWRGQTQMGVKPEPILMGESWSYTFTEPGEFKWFSTARPTIQGTIYIEE